MAGRAGGTGQGFALAALRKQVAARDELIRLLLDAGVPFEGPGEGSGPRLLGVDGAADVPLSDVQFELLRKVLAEGGS